MGYGLYPVAIEWNRLRRIRGSHDPELVEALAGSEWQHPGEAILRGDALVGERPDACWYAVEVLCNAVGTALDHGNLDRVSIDALAGIDERLGRIGITQMRFVTVSPSGFDGEAILREVIPVVPDGFPGVYLFPPDVCAEAEAAFRARGNELLSETDAYFVAEVRDWLDERGPDDALVVFHY
jgi:hypothetical protein